MHISTVSKLLRKGFLAKGSKGGTVLYVAMSCRYDFVFSCVFSVHMTHDQKDVEGPQHCEILQHPSFCCLQPCT